MHVMTQDSGFLLSHFCQHRVSHKLLDLSELPGTRYGAAPFRWVLDGPTWLWAGPCGQHSGGDVGIVQV